MAFSAADVKNLREMTGVGMMDCKKALTAADGDIDKAVEWLREKGLAAAQKKAGRIAAEGMAYATVVDGIGVIVEVNAESDFVAKNDLFVDYVKGVAAVVAKENPADLDALYACAKQHPGELRLIAIGPLTNVAIALTKYPELKTLLHTILIMGGAAVGGNVTPAAEFNIYADPDAAQIVFKSGVPIVMCGLDVTMQAQILDLMNHLKEKRGTSILLITHDLGVVARMADRIAVMYAGKIVEYGGARQVFYQPSHPYTWGLLGAMPNLIQDVKSELYAIPGTPPDLYAPPKGCAFAARCPYAMEACLKEDPPEFVCGQGHGSRCWLLDRRAPDVTPPEGIPPLPKGGSCHV